MGRLARFWRDLKRRRIFQASGLYIVVAWAVIQAASIAFPAFGFPAWAMRAVLVAAFAGFPVLAILAWVFDVSADGVDVTSAEGAAPAASASAQRRWLRPLVAAPILAVIVGGTAWLWTSHLATTGQPEFTQQLRPDELPIVAVLPLENLTGRRELEWAGKGLATLVRDNLAQSRYLAVVSAARSMRLAPAGASVDQVMLAAAEAGITHVMTGEILRTPKGLTVTSRLTDLRRNVEVAANRQEGLTPEQVLTVATPVSAVIKQGLGVPGTERIDVFSADFATAHIAAYEAFIAGMENFLRYNYVDAKRAFELAVEKAPAFAMARYRLAHTMATLGDTGGALEAVRRARQDAARLPARERAYIEAGEAYFARQYAQAETQYRALLRDYPYETEARLLLMYVLMDGARLDEALVEAETLAQQDPGDEVAWSAVADLSLKLDRFDAAEPALARLREIAPQNPNTPFLAGDSQFFRERFDEAAKQYEESLRLDPAFGDAALRLAQIDVLRGRRAAAIERLRATANAESFSTSFRTDAVMDLFSLLRADGRCAEAEQALDLLQPQVDAERIRVGYALWLRAQCRLDEGKPDEARALAALAIDQAISRKARYVLVRGLAELAAGDTAAVEATIAELEGLAATPADETERKAALYLRGMLQLRSGAMAAAVETLKTAVDAPGTQYGLYALDLARAQAAAGDRNTASRTAREAAARRDLHDLRLDLERSRQLAAEFGR
jgi:TolB-like protein/Flp pilus assembly protein TadD